VTDTFKQKQIQLDRLLQEFEFTNVSYFEALVANSNLQAFHCHFDSHSNMEEYWLQWVNYLTGEVLSKQGRSFQRTNTYVIFSCSEKISKELRYTIENNKFSVRKLVLVGDTSQITPSEVITYLNQKILISDIEIDSADSVRLPLKLSPLSEELLKDFANSKLKDQRDSEFFSNWLSNMLQKEVE